MFFYLISRQLNYIVSSASFFLFWRSEAETGTRRIYSLQDEVPEVGRHLLPAWATVMEVKNHNRDYDRNGRDGHHHRQVDA